MNANKRESRGLTETPAIVVLTVNGRAKLVVQDAASYQKLLNLVERQGAIEGIKRGLEDVKARRTQSLEEVFKEIRRSHGLSR